MFDRILGIDYGDSRTGVAMSDLLGITAQPVETIQSNNDDQNVISRIIEIISANKVKTVVYGYPKNMNGTVGPRGEKTDEFVKLLKQQINNDTIVFVASDERLTSVIANRAMTEMGVKKKNKKGVVDQIAAVQILQNYLDLHRK